MFESIKAIGFTCFSAPVSATNYTIFWIYGINVADRNVRCAVAIDFEIVQGACRFYNFPRILRVLPKNMKLSRHYSERILDGTVASR